MRHVRYDEGLFEFSLEPFPAFRPTLMPQEAVLPSAALPVVGAIQPDAAGMLPIGSFSVVRPPQGPLAVTPADLQEAEIPGILLFAKVTGDTGTLPELVEGLPALLIDLPVAQPQMALRAFCAVLRGDDQVVVRTVGADGSKNAHVFRADGSSNVIPWEGYEEEWKLRRLARLCFD